MASVRLANPQDAKAIAHVHVQSWRTTYAGIVPEDYLTGLDEAGSAITWHERIAGGLEIYVADLDGEVVGFITGGPSRELVTNCDAELYAIYLLDRAQRIGMGSDLLRALSTSLHAKGFRAMLVWVLEQNGAKHFYERLGAIRVTSKDIEIGGASLEEIAFKWPDLALLVSAT